MHLSEINIYPIKSCRGISLAEAVVEERGLQFDRRWMLVDENNRFLTQREYPVMALLRTEVTSDELRVTSPSGSIRISPAQTPSRKERVVVWQSTVDAVAYGDEVNEFFSEALWAKVRLVYMQDETRRHINPRFDRGEDIVSFADGYPLMVLSEASVDELNSRLAKNADEVVRVPLPMNRFRPNLVVSGADAFAEDDWKTIRVGDAVFRSTKPCERCVITTTDQAKGEVDGKEPLKTLATYRLAKMVMPERIEGFGVPGNAVLFGQNLVNETPGATVKVGDVVEILA